MTSKKVFYLHIPKTAGTTLRNILHRQYDEKDIFTLDYTKTIEESYVELSEIGGERIDNLSLIKGHFPFGFHNAISKNNDFTYITLLRDPIERVISHYYYELIPNRPYHKIAREMPLKDYIKFSGVKEIDNGQVRFISGDLNASFLACTDEMLEKAKQNLVNHFSSVGIAEYFDTSIVLFKEKLRWSKHVFYIDRNINTKKRRVSQEEIELIAEYNKFDIALYNFAKELLSKQIQEIKGLDNKMKLFRTQNNLLQYIYPIIKRPRIFINKLRDKKVEKRKLV